MNKEEQRSKQENRPRSTIPGLGSVGTGPSSFRLPFRYSSNFELTSASDWHRTLLADSVYIPSEGVGGEQQPFLSGKSGGHLHPKYCGGFAAVCFPDRAPKRYASFHNPDDTVEFSSELFDWWVEIAWKDTMCLASSLELMERSMAAKCSVFSPATSAQGIAGEKQGNTVQNEGNGGDRGPEFSCKLVTFDVYGKSALFVVFRDHLEADGSGGALHFLLLHVTASKAAKLQTALGSWLRHDFSVLISEFLRGEFSSFTTADGGGGVHPAIHAEFGDAPAPEHLGNGLLKILFRLEKFVTPGIIDPVLYMNHPRPWLELVDAGRLRQFPKLKLLLYDIVTLALSRYHVILADQDYADEMHDEIMDKELEIQGWLGLLSLFFPLHRLHAGGTGLGDLQQSRLDRPYHLGGPVPGLHLQRCSYSAWETSDQLLRCPEMQRLVETAPASLAGCCIFLHEAIDAARRASDSNAEGMGQGKPTRAYPWRQHMKVTTGHVSRTHKQWETLSSINFQPHPLVIESVDFVIAQVNEGLGTLHETKPQSSQFSGSEFVRAGGDGANFQHNILAATDQKDGGVRGGNSDGDSHTRLSSGASCSRERNQQAPSVWRLLPEREQTLRKKVLALHFMQWRRSLVETCLQQWPRLEAQGVNEELNVIGIVATTLQISKETVELMTKAAMVKAIEI